MGRVQTVATFLALDWAYLSLFPPATDEPLPALRIADSCHLLFLWHPPSRSSDAVETRMLTTGSVCLASGAVWVPR